MPQDEAPVPTQPTFHRPEHERLLLDLSAQDWVQWQHHPITAAYLRFLQDQAEAFRTAAADLLEAGTLAAQADMLRGRILNLRELQTLELGDIQRFYRHEVIEAEHGTEADQGPSR
jgi:hypothetical protein